MAYFNGKKVLNAAFTSLYDEGYGAGFEEGRLYEAPIAYAAGIQEGRDDDYISLKNALQADGMPAVDTRPETYAPLLTDVYVAAVRAWQAETKSGYTLPFLRCKGGPFSSNEAFGLKVGGRTFQEGAAPPTNPAPIQCVTSGTRIRATGKNLFGGELLVSTVERVAGVTRHAQEKSVTYAASKINSKSILNGSFKADTVYSIVLSGYCTNAETGFANMAVEYTDGVTATITCIGTNSQKATGIYYTAADKTVRAIVGMWNSGSSTLFYDECGMFEGRVTLSEFEPCTATEVTVPCDLYEGDTWWPATGKVERHSRVIDSYAGETVSGTYLSSTGGLDHGIDGNNMEQMQHAKETLQNHLINR